MSSPHSPNAIDRVLLTGGTSYLGRALAARLLERGADVHVIVRPGSDRSRLADLPGDPVLHVHRGETDGLMDIVAAANPSSVFHLATHYLRDHGPGDLPDLVNANILFGVQLLEAMKAAGVSRLINLGSYFQFYDSPAYRPLNLYAATKQAFEDIIAYYEDACGLRSASLVLYDVYGPDDWRPKLMSAIRDAQIRNEPLNLARADAVMDLVYIDDVVDALIHAALEEVAGGPYAVDGGERATLEEIVRTFERVGGKPIERKFGAYAVPARTPAKPWRGVRLPGWQARVGLEEGVRRFLAAAA